MKLSICFGISQMLSFATASIQQAGICVEDKSMTLVQIGLTCPNNTMIHVVSENLGDGNTTCLTKDDSSTVVRDSTSKALVVNCNDHQSCSETVPTSYNRCNTTKIAVNVVRECITGSIDMYTVVDQVTNEPLYLHSPGFPESVGVKASCNCQITGSDMTVTLLEHYTRGQVLNISSDGSDVWPDRKLLSTQYNTQLAQATKEVTVSYTNNNITDGNIWIRITGTGTIKVTCSMGTTIRTSTQASTVTVSDETTTRSESANMVSSTDMTRTGDADNLNTSNTVVIVAAVCGVVVFLLVATIVSLLVYFKLIKPLRNTAAPSTQRSTNPENNEAAHYEVVTEQVSREPNNAYSDLSRYENHGSHEYGRIHVYGNTGSGDGATQDTNTYSGLANYANVEDHHNCGNIENT